MRVYHERLWVPWPWWLVGLAVVVILAEELATQFGWLLGIVIYAVLVGGWAALLLSWSRPQVAVGGGELTAARARLPLAAAGEVSPLDRAQTRVIIGPRADPAAFVLMRPHLRRAVYVGVTDPEAGTVRRRRLGWRRWRPRAAVTETALSAPYWVVGTRHPDELAAAIIGARPTARAGGAAVG
jgi:Protein of unknown function (DUF3093)